MATVTNAAAAAAGGSPVLSVKPLSTPPYPTLDPFMFAVYHNDAYPAGNAKMEVSARSGV